MKNKKVSKSVFENILIAVSIMLYFILINFTYYTVSEGKLLLGLKILSMLALALGLGFMEVSYRKESGMLAVNSVEILALAGHTLSIAHVVQAKNLNFANYIIISSYVFSIYYILKAIIVFTKEKRKMLESFCDIKEIVNNEPVKKEAERRNV